MLLRISQSLIIAVLFAIVLCPAVHATVVRGMVTDFDSGEPIPFASVRVEGTSQTTICNAEGSYRLLLNPGKHDLKFSHVAFYSDRVTLTVGDSAQTYDARLHPSLIKMPGTKIYGRAYDPGQRIILEAIKRKKDLLSQLHDYRFDAYTRLSIRKERPQDTAEAIWFILEMQMEAFWEQPDKYKEVILARRQTANLPPEANMLNIDEILDFNRNRLEIGRYSMVTPTAEDALDHYNYYLLDTLMIDSQQIFRLEIEPKNPLDPLFKGIIDIADSSFAVVGVDVGFSEGVDMQFADTVRYTQRFAEFGEKYWMPYEIRFSAYIDFPIPGIPPVSFDYVAALTNFQFELGSQKGLFDEFVLEVADEADDIDSAAWDTRQTIPLTEEELQGYHRIDSLENIPPKIHKRLLGYFGTALSMTMFGYGGQYFHFNRVEGPYLGLGTNLDKLAKEWTLSVRTGYAFDAEFWQHRYGVSRNFLKNDRLTVGIQYRDIVSRRPTMNSSSTANNTLYAFWSKHDPLDYYREKGFRLFASGRPLKHTRLSVSLHDYDQTSMDVNNDYSLFDRDAAPRENPAIQDGRLRSVSGTLELDSRPLIRIKGDVVKSYAFPFSVLTVTVEHSGDDYWSPIDSDFDFSRIAASFYHTRRLGSYGVTSILLKGGASHGELPPQRYFTVDYGGALYGQMVEFKTLGRNNYYGNEAFAAYASHDFGRLVFKRTRIPLVKYIPLSLFIYGGTFWTDFDLSRKEIRPDPASHEVMNHAYREVGFGLGHIPPIGLRSYFTWRIMTDGQTEFSWMIGL